MAVSKDCDVISYYDDLGHFAVKLMMRVTNSITCNCQVHHNYFVDRITIILFVANTVSSFPSTQ